MSTNYYFNVKNCDTILENINPKYMFLFTESVKQKLFDEIHICKLSTGWKPVFQGTEHYKTRQELIDFYEKNKDYLVVVDEYGCEMVFDELLEECRQAQINVSNRPHANFTGSHYRYCPANYAWIDGNFS